MISSPVEELERSRCSRREERGIRLSLQLRRSLKDSFDARLVGSWAFNEAHLPRPVDHRIFSMSDVDVLLDHQPSIRESKMIAEAATRTGEENNLVFAKVSVRHQAEISALWHPDRIAVCSKSKKEAGRFLLFWTCIGAVEASAVQARQGVAAARAYGLAKFFFKFCRNALLFTHLRPETYRDIVISLRTQLSCHPAIINAYKIKLGGRDLFDQSDEDVLLSKHLWTSMAEPITDTTTLKSLETIRNQMWCWYRMYDTIPVDVYLQLAESIADGPEMTHAWEKTLSDHRRRQYLYEK